MTVCIGAICDDGHTAIIASDRMVTSNYPPIKFEHTRRKIFHLTDYCAALTAGDALKPISIIPKVKAFLGKNPSIESIAEDAKKHYQVLRAEKAEEFFLNPRTITKEVFYTKGAGIFPPDLFNLIDSQFIRFDFGLDLLIVGVDELGAHIYTVRNPGTIDCFNTLGFHAIGVGELHAVQVFIAHRYNKSYTMSEAINIVYAAKKAAEVAPGVGRETDIALIVKSHILNVEPETIKELSKIYSAVTKTPLDEMREKSVKLDKLMAERVEVAEKKQPQGEEDEKRKKPAKK